MYYHRYIEIIAAEGPMVGRSDPDLWSLGSDDFNIPVVLLIRVNKTQVLLIRVNKTRSLHP